MTNERNGLRAEMRLGDGDLGPEIVVRLTRQHSDLWYSLRPAVSEKAIFSGIVDPGLSQQLRALAQQIDELTGPDTEDAA